jgi:hypothetical protein
MKNNLPLLEDTFSESSEAIFELLEHCLSPRFHVHSILQQSKVKFVTIPPPHLVSLVDHLNHFLIFLFQVAESVLLNDFLAGGPQSSDDFVLDLEDSRNEFFVEGDSSLEFGCDGRDFDAFAFVVFLLTVLTLFFLAKKSRVDASSLSANPSDKFFGGTVDFWLTNIVVLLLLELSLLVNHLQIIYIKFSDCLVY